MPSYAFTPAGVEDKLEELYALNNDQLEAQAVSIEADCQAWLRANFTFTTPQGAYLAAFNTGALKYFGQQCAFCFRHRLQIDLVYPAPPAPGMAKWTCDENDIVVKGDDTGDVEVTGSLSFKMEYR